MHARQPLPISGAWVELYEVDEHGDTATPAVFHVREPNSLDAPALVIVIGPLTHLAARARAVDIASRQADVTLRIAVVELEGDSVPTQRTQVSELQAAYHAVLLVSPVQRQEVVHGLLQTMLATDGQEQWIGCDWHDVRRMVRASGAAFVRYGCGRGTGSERATVAVREAVVKAERQGAGLHAAGGICVGIRARSRAIYGREIKEVIAQIRTRMSHAAAIAMSIGCDDTLPDDVLAVDLFAFGELDDAALSRQSSQDNDAALGDADHQNALQGDGTALDPLYATARALVLLHQAPSIALVQRHLRIGYTRASRLLDAMEGDILSAKDAQGKRVVLA